MLLVAWTKVVSHAAFLASWNVTHTNKNHFQFGKSERKHFLKKNLTTNRSIPKQHQHDHYTLSQQPNQSPLMTSFSATCTDYVKVWLTNPTDQPHSANLKTSIFFPPHVPRSTTKSWHDEWTLTGLWKRTKHHHCGTSPSSSWVNKCLCWFQRIHTIGPCQRGMKNLGSQAQQSQSPTTETLETRALTPWFKTVEWKADSVIKSLWHATHTHTHTA